MQISQERKEFLTLNKKDFSSFLMGFQMSEIVSLANIILLQKLPEEAVVGVDPYLLSLGKSFIDAFSMLKPLLANVRDYHSFEGTELSSCYLNN